MQHPLHISRRHRRKRCAALETIAANLVCAVCCMLHSPGYECCILLGLCLWLLCFWVGRAHFRNDARVMCADDGRCWNADGCNVLAQRRIILVRLRTECAAFVIH